MHRNRDCLKVQHILIWTCIWGNHFRICQTHTSLLQAINGRESLHGGGGLAGARARVWGYGMTYYEGHPKGLETSHHDKRSLRNRYGYSVRMGKSQIFGKFTGVGEGRGEGHGRGEA